MHAVHEFKDSLLSYCKRIFPRLLKTIEADPDCLSLDQCCYDQQ